MPKANVKNVDQPSFFQDLADVGLNKVTSREVSYSGIFAVPMVVSPVIIKNGLVNRLTNYMSEVLFTTRLDLIENKLLKPKTSIFDYLVGAFVLASTVGTVKTLYDKFKKTESVEIKIGKSTILVQPILVKTLTDAKNIKPSGLKHFLDKVLQKFSMKTPTVNVVYEKHPTVILEKGEEAEYGAELDNCNIMVVNLLNGNVEIKCLLKNNSYTMFTTMLDNIPSGNKGNIDIAQLATILKGLQK